MAKAMNLDMSQSYLLDGRRSCSSCLPENCSPGALAEVANYL